MSNIKHPIINGKKECSNCHKELLIKKFHKRSINEKTVYRSTCIKCRREYTLHKYYEARLHKYPHLYNQCENEDCNSIGRSYDKWCSKCGYVSKGDES